MVEGFLIGEAAAIFGLQVDTLRYYDKIGLLKPSERAENGYRLYSIPDVRRLRFIVLCRKLDMPIQKIRQLLEKGNLEQFIQQLDKRKESIEKQIRELQKITDLIEETSSFITSNNIDGFQFSIQKYPERYYCTLAENIQFMTEIESINELKPAIMEFVKTGDTSDLLTNRLGEIVYLNRLNENDQVLRDFVYYSGESDSRARNVIPEGRFAVLRFREYLEVENQDVVKDLLEWVSSAGEEVKDSKVYIVMQIDTDFSGQFEDHVAEISVQLK